MDPISIDNFLGCSSESASGIVTIAYVYLANLKVLVDAHGCNKCGWVHTSLMWECWDVVMLTQH